MGRRALSSAGSPCDVGSMSRPRLTVGEKLVYGFGDIIIALRMSSFQFYLLPFYTDVVLLAPWLAGIGKMIGLLWDGINDPLVGHLSDRTRCRLGRRRPYLLATAVPLGIAFAAVWSPPAGLGAAAAFAWLVGAFFVLDTIFTLYATPYMALGAELSTDYHERTQLAAARALFHLLGLMAGVTLPAAILARFPGAHAEGYRVVGVTLGLAMIVVALVTGSLLRERRSAPETAGEGGFRDFVDTLAGTLRNPSFRVLITTFGFILLGGGLYQTLVPYAITYWLGRPAAVGGILRGVHGRVGVLAADLDPARAAFRQGSRAPAVHGVGGDRARLDAARPGSGRRGRAVSGDSSRSPGWGTAGGWSFRWRSPPTSSTTTS